ncbi:MAG: hypothetical protein WAV41_01070 [Microgenomates group bacterium]
MNESKANPKNRAQWDKWEREGKLAGMDDGIMERALEKTIEVIGTGTSFENGRPVRQTLSLGKVLVWKKEDFACYRPVISVVVEGDNFRPGDVVSREILPKNVKPVSRFYKKG